MKYLLYTKIGEDSIKSSLGLPEYSYFFVYREFKRIFSSLGEVVSVHNEVDIARESQLAQQQQQDFIVVFFCPPHVAPDVNPHKAFCVLAWEFDSIPDEPWGGDPRNDWRYVLKQHVGVVCLSSETKAVLQKRMGAHFLVADISVPVWDQFKAISRTNVNKTASGAACRDLGVDLPSISLQVDGNIVDNREYEITDSTFFINGDSCSLQVADWAGETLSFDFSNNCYDSAYLGGFYKSEIWGSWSRLVSPWLQLDRRLSGSFDIELVVRGFGATIGQRVSVSVGGVTRDFILTKDPLEHRLSFSQVQDSNIIYFTGLNLTPQLDFPDNRTMALGLQTLRLVDKNSNPRSQVEPSFDPVNIELEGVVYTSVFNPVDARKNWEDIVSAFCFAFRDQAEVTLLLKITHGRLSSFLGRLNFLLQKIGAIQCRVVAVHGFLSAEGYRQLIDSSTFYVNASSAEGLCLPMMEFMAAGVPALTPDHTAMADYIDTQSSFVVESSKAPTIWPHDPRQLKRACDYRVCWQSLVDRFLFSHRCALFDGALYTFKSDHSKASIEQLSSDDIVLSRIEDFLASAGV